MGGVTCAGPFTAAELPSNPQGSGRTGGHCGPNFFVVSRAGLDDEFAVLDTENLRQAFHAICRVDAHPIVPRNVQRHCCRPPFEPRALFPARSTRGFALVATAARRRRAASPDLRDQFPSPKTNSAPPCGVAASISLPISPMKPGGPCSRPATTATYCLPSIW